MSSSIHINTKLKELFFFTYFNLLTEIITGGALSYKKNKQTDIPLSASIYNSETSLGNVYCNLFY